MRMRSGRRFFLAAGRRQHSHPGQLRYAGIGDEQF
jgi:hypothetical protein